MAERKENSVLFSLNELRSIEEERQQEAQDAKRRAEEDRTRAQMEAERRAREESEARQRAIEEAERAARDATERATREERIRIEEAERRARVEAQANLEHQRMSQEMQIRAMEAQKKRPTGLIALAAILVVAVAGLGVFLVQRSNEAEKKAEELAAYQNEVNEQTAELKRLVDEQNLLITDLRNAKDVEARQRAEAALEAKQKEIAAKDAALRTLKNTGRSNQRSKPRGGGDDKPKDTGVKIKCDPNDPLCGI